MGSSCRQKKDAPDGFSIWICNWYAHMEGRIEDTEGHEAIQAKRFALWKK